MNRSKLRILSMSAAAVLLASCGALDDAPSETSAVVQESRTKTTAKRLETGMNEALRCVGRMMRAHGVPPFSVMSLGLPDKTGKVYTTAQEGTVAGPATRDMLISAISAISEQSHSVYFIEWENVSPVNVGLNVESAGSIVPDYFISGGITQVDQDIVTKSAAAGADVSIGSATIGGSFGKGSGVSLVTVDMNVGKLPERYMIPGLSVSNTIALSSKDRSIGAEAFFTKLGLNFDISDSRKNGIQLAVRALVEMGLIELIGRKEGLPYWECLDVDTTRPEVMARLHDAYESMADSKRVSFVQRKLAAAGYYKGKIDGRQSEAVRAAISRFKAANNKLPTGDIDFHLYVSLASDKYPVRASAKPERPTDAAAEAFKVLSKRASLRRPIKKADSKKADSKKAAPADKAPVQKAAREEKPAAKPAAGPVKLAILSSKSVYRKGEKIVLDVSLSASGHVHCYYQDSDGSVARIFPNRFHTSDRLSSPAAISIPSTNMPFSIVADKLGTQGFQCYAAPGDIGAVLQTPELRTDLAPLKVKSLADIASYYRSTPKLPISEKSVHVAVR